MQVPKKTLTCSKRLAMKNNNNVSQSKFPPKVVLASNLLARQDNTQYQ